MPKFAIFFRGDSREPIERFKDGFQPRTPTPGQPFMIRSFTAGPNAICVTQNFKMSAAFPLDRAVTESWIYIVAIDIDEKDETRLLDLYTKELPNLNQDNVVSFSGLHSTKEYLVNNIPGEHILGAFPIRRTYKDDGNPLSFVQYFEVSGETRLNPKSRALLAEQVEFKSELDQIISAYSKKESDDTFYICVEISIVPYRNAFYAKNKAKLTANLFSNQQNLTRENEKLFERINKGDFDAEVNADKAALLALIDQSYVNMFSEIVQINPSFHENEMKNAQSILEQTFDPRHEKIPKTFAFLKR